MQLEAGRNYRARTSSGDQITFVVISDAGEVWTLVNLDSADGPEPGVWLNTRLLLWISPEQRRAVALDKAADEVIEALERTSE